MNSPKRILTLACILGATVVGIGAFGAHGLEDLLVQNGRTDTFETAVHYQFYHTLALFFTGLLMLQFKHRFLRLASICFFLGILLFSGSLYVLSLTNITFLGAITPLGGIGFIAGWLFLGLGIKSMKSE